MTTVDLEKIGDVSNYRMDALLWLYRYKGPCGDKWDIDDLRYVVFNDSSDATEFALKWTQ